MLYEIQDEKGELITSYHSLDVCEMYLNNFRGGFKKKKRISEGHYVYKCNDGKTIRINSV